jgi:excisionase family DNA binding protein
MPDARCTATTMTSGTFTTSAIPKATRPPMPEMTDVGPEALDLLTMAEVAERLRLSEKTVQRMVRQGVFTKLKLGSLVRIDPAEVVAYKQRLHEQAKAS